MWEWLNVINQIINIKQHIRLKTTYILINGWMISTMKMIWGNGNTSNAYGLAEYMLW